MKLFATLVLIATPLTAMAAPVSGVAKLSGATAAAQKIVVNNSIWQCADGACRGPGEERRVAVERICKELVRKVGAVETLSVGAFTLSAEDVAKCNAKA